MAATGVQILLLASLYAFLGALLIFLWLDERRAARGAPAPPPAHLRSLAPDSTTSYPLASSTLLGRAADNAIRLDDPLVSAYHARISFAGGQWLVEDLGSRNGTQVNDLRVESPVALIFGDVLHLGGAALRFEPGPVPSGDAETAANDGRTGGHHG
ncbi:MAG TPA: FHA domain-containing protein [Anaerolineales bacterium]|nr:FHA domain-containing protein [Anaerolineales bacterium]